MPSVEPFRESGISGFLHTPDSKPVRGMVLTHGAGANCEAPLLVRVASEFAARGYAVLRCDLAFRQNRRSGPPHPSKGSADRESLKKAAAALQSITSGPILLGGHSYGGRQASMLAAEEPDIAEALLLLSYPLHPPARPDQLRTEHFPKLRTPSLFVSGTRDGFASPEELRQAIAAIPARTAISLVDAAGHDLNPKRLDIEALVIEPFTNLLASTVA